MKSYDSTSSWFVQVMRKKDKKGVEAHMSGQLVANEFPKA